MIKRPVAIFTKTTSATDFAGHARLEAERTLQLQIRAMLVAMAVLECANSAASFVLPFYFDKTIGLGWVGLTLTVYYIISLSTAAWFGSLSDKLGRKRFIVGGAFLIGFTYLPFPTFQAIERATKISGVVILLFASIGKAIGAAMMAGSIIAIFADVTNPETRGETMGKFYAFRAAGGAVGFVVGGVLWVLIGVRGFIVFGFIIFIAGLLFFRMREPRKFAIMIRELEPPLKASNPFTAMIEILRNRQFRTFSIVWLSYTSMIGLIVTYLPVTLADITKEEGVTGVGLGIIILIVLIIAGGAQPLYGRLSDVYGRKPFLLLGVQSTAIAVFFLYQLLTQAKTIARFMDNPFSSLEVTISLGNMDVSVSSYILLIFLVVILLGAAAFPSASMGLLTDVTDEDERGQGMGLYSSLSAVGNIIGIAMGGLFFGLFKIQGLMALCLFFALVSAMVVMKFLIETTTFRWLPGT